MKNKKKLLKIWKNEICLKPMTVDPEQNYVWEGIFVGLGIGLGFTANEARKIYDKEGFEYEDQEGVEDNE